jgi:NAD(P)-dependent dehydrogenase (short-subunit alcohol dehydrogenase family)
MRVELDGRVAAITGAGSGLGLAMARELAGAGAQVAILERDEAAAERAVAELSGEGARVCSVPVDVSDSRQVDDAFAEVVRRLGGLDIAVNNAAVERVGPHTHDVSDDDWSETIAVNQTGVFHGMRAAGRIMIERGGGRIVNIASIRGLSPNPGRLAYCASKAAVIMMTKVAAGEWGRHGVRVNVVAPGVCSTPMWQRMVDAGLLDEAEYRGLVPLGALGEPRQIAEAVAFLSSDAAAYVNGAVLTVDGGLTSLPAG